MTCGQRHSNRSSTTPSTFIGAHVFSPSAGWNSIVGVPLIWAAPTSISPCPAESVVPFRTLSPTLTVNVVGPNAWQRSLT